MKFALSDSAGSYLIHAYRSGEITIGEQRFTSSLMLLPDQIHTDWSAGDFSDLELLHFRTMAEFRPDLIILGTGEQQRFPRPALYQPLISQGIGMEVMTTPAACRTYNILVSEGRRPLAALILG
ncbi:MAG: Xcc1710-like domain-containing protein [Gammaproteobacteria bacterium]|nr:Xcc1710-like domain-containing protein [Gammaproteobacteria bacterium]